MRLLRNNWTIIGATLLLWLLSWFFVYVQHWPIGDKEFYIWMTGKALLPLIAIIGMYAMAVHTASLRKRNKFIVHLTYLTVLWLSTNTLRVGWKDSITWDDTAIDWSCIFALVVGGIVFWFFRGIEFLMRSVRNMKSIA